MTSESGHNATSWERGYLAAVIIVALVFAAATAANLGRTGVLSRSGDRVHPSSAGMVRNLDVKRIKQMIREGYLSDHEALFYQPAPTQ
jgi:hypothetical protein